MREPPFWWRKAGLQAALLSPFAACYGAIAALRLRFAGRAAGIPVICVGNPTVGGAGKTPAALAIGRLLIAAGRRVFFLSRGYGGECRGPMRVDPARHGAKDVGDEPLLLARVAPTIVARDRVAGAAMARAAGATVIVMDDGFQNPSLHKDMAILVVDGRRGTGNGWTIPSGPLRAPLGVQLDHADALLIVGTPSGASAAATAGAVARNIPIFHAQFEAEGDAVAALLGHRLLAFAGIGDPEKFFATLADSGIPAAVTRSFPDHYRYSRVDSDALLAEAAKENLILLTTEKDLVRIARQEDVAGLSKAVRALPVTLQVEEEDALRELLMRTA
jgi:tetraacyldisaccharide 4'-kinase